MHARGEDLPDAAEGLGLAAEEIEAARDRLVRLRLLNPDTHTTVDAAAALARSLASSHRALDNLVEQHVMTASLARNYIGLGYVDSSDTRIEFHERKDGATVLQQRIDELAELSRYEVMGMHPPTAWSRENMIDADARSARAISRGVRVRSLNAQSMLTDPGMREHLRARAAIGVEVRAAPVIPARMLIYDRRIAIIQADPGDLSRGAVLIHGHNIVLTLAALYDYCWLLASEPEDVPGSADRTTLTAQQRAVLRLLATGAKDDAIARGLGVSTRTVTRLVGELTTMLGAGSRFQAGVRAARLGWLD
ncbi:hypothetical protein CA984_40945 [Streptosporangium minutum]|uniref:HTH luxR-type domain-containing protein n=2 Tax=Streptosporangium minutum TaxID=569862 RepID=A0A243QPB0_9ACTN|nr:hypothetical protein CA984_40945 [Streptosporangium minutum]